MLLLLLLAPFGGLKSEKLPSDTFWNVASENLQLNQFQLLYKVQNTKLTFTKFPDGVPSININLVARPQNYTECASRFAEIYAWDITIVTLEYR